jgi:hypothetical protein
MLQEPGAVFFSSPLQGTHPNQWRRQGGGQGGHMLPPKLFPPPHFAPPPQKNLLVTESD